MHWLKWFMQTVRDCWAYSSDLSNLFMLDILIHYTPPLFLANCFRDSSYNHVFTSLVEKIVDSDQLVSQNELT